VSYIALRGRLCNIIILNVHAPSEEKCDDFPMYYMKILLGDFNAEVGKDNIFKTTIGNESLHQDT